LVVDAGVEDAAVVSAPMPGECLFLLQYEDCGVRAMIQHAHCGRQADDPAIDHADVVHRGWHAAPPARPSFADRARRQRRRIRRLLFTHTEVDDAYQGQGVAGQLARSVLDAARQRSLTVTPQCDYIAGYIGKHSEYADLVGEGDRALIE